MRRTFASSLPIAALATFTVAAVLQGCGSSSDSSDPCADAGACGVDGGGDSRADADADAGADGRADARADTGADMGADAGGDSRADGARPPDASAPRADIGMSDVSVLWPLPTGRQRAQLLAPTSAGKGGPLVPAAVLDRVPTEAMPAPGSPPALSPALRAALRLVAVRLDPCFSATIGGACEPQVRLIFQPLLGEGDDTAWAADSALHAFYRLTAADLDAAVSMLAAQRMAAGAPTAIALDAHQALRAQGPDGTFARALRQRVVALCGPANLRRLTFMISNAQTWRFGGFEIEGESVRAMRIAGVTTAEQDWAHTTPTVLNGTSTPAFTVEPDFTRFLTVTGAQMAPRAAQEAAYRAALRIENPRAHTADSVDCVSCHVATIAREWADRTLGLRQLVAVERYTAPDGLSAARPGLTPLDGTRVRAFGYHDRALIVSQRTVNETAEVVAAMRTRLRDSTR